MSNKTANSVINRIQYAMRFNSDSEMSMKLNINRATLGNWRFRNSVPYSLCVSLSESDMLCLNWLLTGKGTIFRNDQVDAIVKIGTKIESDIANLINEFSEEEQQEILVILKEKKRISELEATVRKIQSLLSDLQAKNEIKQTEERL